MRMITILLAGIAILGLGYLIFADVSVPTTETTKEISSDRFFQQ